MIGYPIQENAVLNNSRNVQKRSSLEKKILNTFKYGIINGVTEGFNNKIKVLKPSSYGIRNFNRIHSGYFIVHHRKNGRDIEAYFASQKQRTVE